MLRLQRRKTFKRTALQDDVHKTALGQQLWGWTRDAGLDQAGQSPRWHQHCYFT